MSTNLSRSLASSECVICTLRLGRSSRSPGPCSAAQGQTRGKKKLVKAQDNIPAKLLQDLPAYGRKGSYVPVGRSQMRNYLFPRRICDYVTLAQVQELKRRSIPIERDTNFGRSAGESEDTNLPKVEKDKGKVDLAFMAPDAAFKVLDRFIPPTVDFYRTPIVNPEPAKPADASEVAPGESQREAQSDPHNATQAGTNIYGSVAISDVATAIKAALSIHDPNGRILLADEDIKFIRAETGEDATDRVKQLGEYDVEIKLKGLNNTIRRKVRVLPERAA